MPPAQASWSWDRAHTRARGAAGASVGTGGKCASSPRTTAPRSPTPLQPIISLSNVRRHQRDLGTMAKALLLLVTVQACTARLHAVQRATRHAPKPSRGVAAPIRGGGENVKGVTGVTAFCAARDSSLEALRTATPPPSRRWGTGRAARARAVREPRSVRNVGGRARRFTHSVLGASVETGLLLGVIKAGRALPPAFSDFLVRMKVSTPARMTASKSPRPHRCCRRRPFAA